jgi:hypothetical protein
MIAATGLRKIFNAGTATEKVAIAGVDLRAKDVSTSTVPMSHAFPNTFVPVRWRGYFRTRWWERRLLSVSVRI